MTRRRGVIALLLLTGVLAATPAHARTADRPSCHIERHGKRHLPARAEFIVHAAGPRLGALGVWEDGSGDQVRIRVEPGEGKATKWRSGVRGREYKPVRCDTV
jgi:hypothetical protein